MKKAETNISCTTRPQTLFSRLGYTAQPLCRYGQQDISIMRDSGFMLNRSWWSRLELFCSLSKLLCRSALCSSALAACRQFCSWWKPRNDCWTASLFSLGCLLSPVDWSCLGHLDPWLELSQSLSKSSSRHHSRAGVGTAWSLVWISARRWESARSKMEEWKVNPGMLDHEWLWKIKNRQNNMTIRFRSNTGQISAKTQVMFYAKRSTSS